MTNFWLRVSLYRDTAPVTANNFVTGDKFVAPIKLVPRHSYNSEKLYHDAKNCAIPSLHRDSFLAKVISTCPGASSGNVFALYCRAVRFQCCALGLNCDILTIIAVHSRQVQLCNMFAYLDGCPKDYLDLTLIKLMT